MAEREFEVDDRPVTRPRAVLLPRLGLLALLDATALVLSRAPGVIFIVSAFAPFYLAVILLRTRDLVRGDAAMHPLDFFLCRWSGPLALCLLAVLVTAASCLIFPYDNLSDSPLLRVPLVLLLQFALETGVMLAMACVCSRASFGDAQALLFWKLICGPLLVIYSVYTLAMMYSRFLANLSRNQAL